MAGAPLALLQLLPVSLRGHTGADVRQFSKNRLCIWASLPSTLHSEDHGGKHTTHVYGVPRDCRVDPTQWSRVRGDPPPSPT